MLLSYTNMHKKSNKTNLDLLIKCFCSIPLQFRRAYRTLCDSFYYRQLERRHKASRECSTKWKLIEAKHKCNVVSIISIAPFHLENSTEPNLLNTITFSCDLNLERLCIFQQKDFAQKKAHFGYFHVYQYLCSIS